MENKDQINDKATRDRVRALVRDVLANTPVEGETEAAPRAKSVEVTPPQSAAAQDCDRDESAKTLITADDLRGLEPQARLRVAENVKFTSLAADLISERQIEIIKKTARQASVKIRSIAIASDHGGFETKEKLKSFLSNQNISVRDFGTNSNDAVDYPDFADAVARSVAAGQADIGIIIDGAGIGSAMTANKTFGVRAAACYNAALAKNSREHNGANVLTLGVGQNSFAEICEIVTAFLAAELTEERHQRRVAKIQAIERQNIKS